jgi:hypothetical protein
MYRVSFLNQHSYYHYERAFSHDFKTISAAKSYINKCIELDKEVESNTCDEIHLLDPDNSCLERWAWCPDDIDAPCSWNKL